MYPWPEDTHPPPTWYSVYPVVPVVPMCDVNVCHNRKVDGFNFNRSQEHWTNSPRYVSATWLFLWKQAGSTRVDRSARSPGIWRRCDEMCGVRWSQIMADCFCLFVRFCESVILWFRIWNCSLDKVHPRLANLLAEGTSEGPHANTSHPNQNAKVHVHQSFLAQRHGSWLFDIFCRHVCNGYLLSMCRVIDISYESVHKETS